jgi:hypothetical protein
VLDVGFGEGLDRKRTGYAAQNFSVLNRIALNLLKQDKTSKRGVHGKRLKAGYSGSPIGVLRKQTVKWLFPQEKATFDKASSA